MNSTQAMNPFLPTNKPKSWTVSALAFMTAVLVVSPLMFLVSETSIGFMLLHKAFVLLILMGFASFFVYVLRFALGHYKHLTDKPWKDQLW